MKKIIVFICLVLFLLPSHVISAQCDDELQGWIDLFRKDEKKLIDCLGYGNIFPDKYIPCDKNKILKMQVDKDIQVEICNGKQDWGYAYYDFSIGDYVIRFLEFKQYKNKSDVNIFEFTAEFTNNSDKSISYNSAIYREVYQDGYELDNYISGEVDTMTKIRPGMSIEVTECFEYREPVNRGIIEIDMHPYFDNDIQKSFSGVIYKLENK